MPYCTSSTHMGVRCSEFFRDSSNWTMFQTSYCKKSTHMGVLRYGHFRVFSFLTMFETSYCKQYKHMGALHYGSVCVISTCTPIWTSWRRWNIHASAPRCAPFRVLSSKSALLLRLRHSQGCCCTSRTKDHKSFGRNLQTKSVKNNSISFKSVFICCEIEGETYKA